MSLTLGIRFALEHTVGISFEPSLQREAVSGADAGGRGLVGVSGDNECSLG